MRAVDTNILVYAEMVTSPFHRRAKQCLRELAEGPIPWALPWPCAYEFLRVVTHPRVFNPPMPADRAISDLESILASPSIVLLSETPRHPSFLFDLFRSSGATGNLAHDAHIAALCREHGVEAILTADRDFNRFPGIKVVNPFTEDADAGKPTPAPRGRRSR